MSAADLPAFVNGRLVAAGEPALSPLDQGFTLGLAVFETLLREGGTVYFVQEHVERLRGGARQLGIAWPPPWHPPEAVAALAEALGPVDAGLRVTLSRGVPGAGPTLAVTARALTVWPAEGVVLALSERAKLGQAPLERIKSTNRLRNVLAQEEAQARGAWEALLPTEEGDFSEGTVSNLFVARDGELVTPSLERGCLAGIVRDKVLQLVRSRPLEVGGRRWTVREGRVERSDIEAADEVFMTNTLGRVLPAVRILGAERDYPGTGGPVARAVRQRIDELERRYREPDGG